MATKSSKSTKSTKSNDRSRRPKPMLNKAGYTVSRRRYGEGGEV